MWRAHFDFQRPFGSTLKGMAKRKAKLGRPKALRPKKQKRFSVAYLHLLEELKPRLAPPGLDLSDGQAIDICIGTLHEMLVQDGLTVVNTDKMLAVLNHHFKKTFSEFLVKVLTEDGRQDVETYWSPDGRVGVKWDTSSISIPAEVFAGEGLDEDGLLRQMRTGKPS